MDKLNTIICSLDKIANKLVKIIEFFVCVFITIISLSVFFGVIGRNINIPVVWLGEASTYSAIWATFLGFSLAYRHDMLANVDMITRNLSQNSKLSFEIIWNVFAIVFMTAVVWSSKDFITHIFNSGTKSPEMRMPLYIVYMGPIIAYILTTYFGFIKLLKQIYSFKSNGIAKNV